MTDQEFGQYVLQLVETSTFPGAVLDSVMHIRDRARALAAGALVTANPSPQKKEAQ